MDKTIGVVAGHLLYLSILKDGGGRGGEGEGGRRRERDGGWREREGKG